jgi:outer membrane protein assembly factor BamB
VVYVGANQTLVALNGSNGSFLWSQDFDTSLSNSKISASDDDTVYVSLDGVLHAIDAEGQSLWKYEANTSIGAPLAIDSEEVFLPCYGGCMILFDHLGNIVWEQCHNSFLAIDSTSVNHSGYSFYTEFPSTVYAIDSDQL